MIHIIKGFSVVNETEVDVFLAFPCFFYGPVDVGNLIIQKAREFHKNIYFCFIDYTKAFDYVGYNKLWKIL